jgi:Flp pilus assembly protein TadB
MSQDREETNQSGNFGVGVNQGDIQENAKVAGVYNKGEQADFSHTHQPPVRAKSAWANGLFYVFLFVTVVVTVNVTAGNLPLAAFVLTIVAGILFVLLVGILQLRQDDRLSEKNFIELAKLVLEQLPLVGNFIKQIASGKSK